MNEWQPIESAPKDGRSVLLFELFHGFDDDDIDGVYAVCSWDGGSWVPDTCVEAEDGAEYSHWMPLPEPPA